MLSWRNALRDALCSGTYVLTRGRITRLMDLQLQGGAAKAAAQVEEEDEEKEEKASQAHFEAEEAE